MRVNAANHEGYVKTSHRLPQYPMLGLNSRLATCLYGYWTVPCFGCKATPPMSKLALTSVHLLDADVEQATS